MESLMQVMAAKKRELSALKAETQCGKKPKYLRRAEVDDLRIEKERQQLRKEEEEKQKKLQAAVAKKRKLETPTATATATPKKLEEKEDEATLSFADMKRRLRELGAPVTLFGETNRGRMARLRTAEHDAASRRADELGDGHATRNEFLDDKDDGVRDRDDDDDERDVSGEETRGRASTEKDAMAGGDGDEQDGNMIVYSFFKGMLRRWEQDLADRPDEIKRTSQGKMATKTMKQCKDYIRPLFKLCKKRDVSSDILPNLVQIVKFCKDGEFVQANDAYIKLAIGNAAWPIGVTMVGIHERTGREKINANKQAHVMNNEAQRKYITSVKRLISYAQSVANVLPSKKVN